MTQWGYTMMTEQARPDQLVRDVRAILGAETAFFEESSHALFFDEPEKFNDLVTRFVTGSQVSR